MTEVCPSFDSRRLEDKMDEDYFSALQMGAMANSNSTLATYLTSPTTKELIFPSEALQKVFAKFNTPLPSSANVERLFSKAGLILNHLRTRLGDSNFEAQVLVKANFDFLR